MSRATSHHLGQKVVKPMLNVSAPSLGVSHSLGSGAQSAAPFATLQLVSRHLNELLKNIDSGASVDAISFKYPENLERVEQIQALRFADKKIPVPTDTYQFTAKEERWTMLAAEVSILSYHPVQRAHDRFLSSSDTGGKPVLLRLASYEGQNILIVGVQGTASWDDWPLNLNNRPVTDSTVVGDQVIYHKGFFKTAKRMSGVLAKEIQKDRKENPGNINLLLTGHSAGGALAQIFHALGRDETTDLGKVFTSFSRVDCITFGTPPVAKPPIEALENQTFLSIINEGDVVPVAQTEYIKVILHLFVLKPTEIEATAKTLTMPEPFYGFSGKSIVLADEDSGDAKSDKVNALRAEPKHLRELLYANIQAHHMTSYHERLEAVFKQRPGKETMEM